MKPTSLSCSSGLSLFAMFATLAVGACTSAPSDAEPGASTASASTGQYDLNWDKVPVDATQLAPRWIGLIERSAISGQRSCTAALIAPNVVFAGAHCIKTAVSPQGNEFFRLAKASGALSRSVKIKAYHLYGSEASGWHNGLDAQGLADPNEHDMALAILEEPLDLGSFPAMANTPPIGTTVAYVGRRDNTSLTSEFVVSPDDVISSQDRLSFGLANEWWFNKGDSDAIVVATRPERIVGVLRGPRDSHSVYAVNSLATWVSERIANAQTQP